MTDLRIKLKFLTLDLEIYNANRINSISTNDVWRSNNSEVIARIAGYAYLLGRVAENDLRWIAWTTAGRIWSIGGIAILFSLLFLLPLGTVKGTP